MANNGQQDPSRQAHVAVADDDSTSPVTPDDATGAEGEEDMGEESQTAVVDEILAQYAEDPKAMAQALIDQSTQNQALAERLEALERRSTERPPEPPPAGAKAPTVEDWRTTAQDAIGKLYESDYAKENPDFMKLLVRAIGASAEYVAEEKLAGMRSEVDSRFRDRFLEEEEPALVAEFNALFAKGDKRALFDLLKRSKLAGKASSGGPRSRNPNTINLANVRKAAASKGSITGMAGRPGSPRVTETEQERIMRKHGFTEALAPGASR